MFRALALAAAIIALPGTAQAESGITYNCDTAAGHWSELVLPAPGQRFSVSGNIRVMNIGKDKKWAPNVKIRVASAPSAPGETPSSFAGLDLLALPGKTVDVRAETVQMFSIHTAGKENDTLASTLKPTGSTEPFRLSFDGQAVAITIGSETRKIPLAVSQPVVQVICSTGEFLITDLRVESSS